MLAVRGVRGLSGARTARSCLARAVKDSSGTCVPSTDRFSLQEEHLCGTKAQGGLNIWGMQSNSHDSEQHRACAHCDVVWQEAKQ